MAMFDENELEEQEMYTDKSDSDNKTLKENLKDYSVKRMSDSVILESHTRATYLVDNDVLEKFNDLISYTEALNGINSSFQSDNVSAKETNRSRAMTKGLKSKIVNYALSDFLTNWESEEGLVPSVEHVRFKINKVYHRAYKFTVDGETYGVEQNNRGIETNFLSTKNGDSLEDIEQWYNQRLELSQ